MHREVAHDKVDHPKRQLPKGIPHDLRKPHAPLFPKAPYARFLHNSRSRIFSTQNLREGRADLITPNARLPTALHPLAFDFLHHRAAFDKPTDRVRVLFLQVSSEIRCSEKRAYSQSSAANSL